MVLKLSSPDGFGKLVQSERVVSDAIAAILQGPTGVRIETGRTSDEGSSRRPALAFVAHGMTCDS